MAFYRIDDPFGGYSGGEMTREEACAYAQKEATKFQATVRITEVDKHGFEIENGYRNHFSH